MDGYHAACGQMENTVLALRRNPCSYSSGAKIKKNISLNFIWGKCVQFVGPLNRF